MTDNKKALGRDKYDLDFSHIHKIINPADIRTNDRVEARIRAQDDKEFKPIRVWKISPLGIELVRPEFGQYKKGSSIDLEILVAGQRVSFEGLIVDVVDENEKISLIGVRLKKPEASEEASNQERRSSPRWICSPDYYPTATAPTPGQISDHMYFKIRDISADGLLLSCSLRNKLPVPGLVLNLTANFGVDGTFNLPVEISHVGFTSEGGKDRLAIGVKFKTLSNRMKSIMGQYLIQFSNSTTLQDLREQGFWPRSVSTAINFYFLTTQSEYEQVLDLRKRAHEVDSNLKNNVSKEDMGDMGDGSSRIIIGTHAGKVVCTARIRFNNSEEPLEHESLVEWPDELPSRNEIIEISRLAIDPDYRHGDLLVGLFEYIAATCVHERRYVVMSCLERMKNFFAKIGFEDTGLIYDGSLFNQEGHVMLGDARSTMLGKQISPLYWNLIWRRVSEYMADAGTLNPSELDRFRLGFYRLFGPATHVMNVVKSWRIRNKAAS